MNNQLLSIIIFVLTYVFIIWEKFDRTIIAIIGASLMLFTNIISQQTAINEIDFNTIGLLIGMMIIVEIMQRSGIFEYLALKIVKLSKASPVKILVMLSLLTGVLSGFLDNVTTVLLIIPITLSIAKDLHLSPIPFVISEIFASNIGGTATLIGDPPNLLIGGAADFSFVEFLKNTGVIALPLLFLTTYIFMIIYRKKLKTTEEIRNNIMNINENKYLRDTRLFIKSLLILVFVICGFVLHDIIHYNSATIAMGGAAALLLVSRIHIEHILRKIEWKTIFFFIALFMLAGGLKQTGVIELLAHKVLYLTGGNFVLTVMGILWISAIASGFVDNIPFVATIIPIIKEIELLSGINAYPLWWALSLGACLGGNGTIIGASANIIAVGIAEESGCRISFKQFLKIAFPLTMLTLVVSSVYLYVMYLMKI